MAIRDAHTTLTRHTQSGYCNRVVWPRIATVSPASVLYAWLGMASLDVGLAQEPSRAPHESGSEQPADQRPDASAVSKPQSESESKREGPPRDPRFLPPVLRPQLTPEELEEAERLRKLAAKYGTDPTAIVGRVQLSSQYADLPHGARFSDSVLAWTFRSVAIICSGWIRRSTGGPIPIFTVSAARKVWGTSRPYSDGAPTIRLNTPS
jgi:hypothetical protein